MKIIKNKDEKFEHGDIVKLSSKKRNTTYGMIVRILTARGVESCDMYRYFLATLGGDPQDPKWDGELTVSGIYPAEIAEGKSSEKELIECLRERFTVNKVKLYGVEE